MEALGPIYGRQGRGHRLQELVDECKNRGLDALVTDASHLPYEDSSFDMVYVVPLLWVKDLKVLKEMKRVSRGWVVCLAGTDMEEG